MGVAAETPADVAAAVAFALEHNIRVAVKSSGHDQMGRSTANGALLVWMRRVSCISVSASFAACPSSAPGPAVTTCPGDDWGSVYEAAGAQGYDVVGGSARTVSSSGGYTLGGGHSWMSPFYGLAVDNVLAFTAVRSGRSPLPLQWLPV
jgi:FAD/FMN-containing dehydrogenase